MSDTAAPERTADPDYKREYHPCRNGIHICGATADEERPLTVANIPNVPRWRFDQLEDHYGIEGDDFDLVVDFMEDGNILSDFAIRRQSLDLLLRDLRSLSEAVRKAKETVGKGE